MVALLPPAELQFCDGAGVPLAGGTIDTFTPGTTTRKTTWSDPAGTVSNTNPVTLDSAGRCVLYGDGAYRCVLKDSAGNTVWDKQASTLVSVAMAPVVIAPDLATARAALGIDGLIGAETTRALAAEAALASSQAGFASAASVTAETARAEAAEAAEVARATAAEAELANSIGLSVKVMAGSGTTDASGYCRVEFSPAFASVHAFVATVAAAAALSVSTVANTDVSGADVRMITTVSYEPAMLGFTWIAVGT